MKNLENIQNQIIKEIYTLSDKSYIRGRQSDTELKIVMRSIYLQHSKNLLYDLNLYQ